MTDNMFASAPEAEEQGSRRKLPILLGGAVGLAVLAGGGWMLLHGGSSTEDTAFVAPHHAPVAKKAVAKKATSKSTAHVTVLPAASSVKIGRDPFAALYVVPSGAGATGATGSTAPAGTSTTPTTTTTAAQPGTTTGSRYALTLTKVTTNPGGAKLFTFKYGTASKTVLPAQRFGKYGELVVLTYVKNSKGAIIGAVLQVGDDNPIEVLTGQKVTVL
jgi:hypothetical protein